MKLRENIKRFWTLDVHNHEGFTLVELIIVIAILAILSSVAVVGYSSYVKKANMQADRTMVAQLISAIELASYMDADKFPSDATLYLSGANAVVTGTDKAKLEAILADAYGAGWAQQLKLKYGEWGLGATVATHAKKLQAALGGNKLSYTDDVDALWDEVETILTQLQGFDVMNGIYGTSANLMGSASDFTVNHANVPSKEAFAKMWADPTNDFAAYIEGASGDDTTEAGMDPLLAQAGANKARNYAFGNYISSNSLLTRVAQEIMTVGQVAGFGPFRTTVDVICSEAEANALAAAVDTYFGQTSCASVVPAGADTYRVSVSSVTPNTSSQAYADALGYFTLMEAVDDSSSETANMTDEEYLSTMGAAVHNVGAMLNNSDLANVEGGCVGITVKKDADGNIVFYITPSEIYAGGSNVQSGVGVDSVKTPEVRVVVDISTNGYAFEVKGSLTLSVGQTGKIVYVLTEAAKEFIANADQNEADFLAALPGQLSATSEDSSIASVNGTEVAGISAGNTTLKFVIPSTIFSFEIPVYVK